MTTNSRPVAVDPIDDRRLARKDLERRRAGDFFAVILLVGLTHAPGPAQAADEMTETEAIAEIKRLRGRVSPAMFTPEEWPQVQREAGEGGPMDPLGMLDARLAGEQFGDEQLKLLKRIPALVHVGISNCVATDEGLQVLRSLPRLTSITVACRPAGPKITDRGVEAIGAAKALKSVQINGIAPSELGEGGRNVRKQIEILP